MANKVVRVSDYLKSKNGEVHDQVRIDEAEKKGKAKDDKAKKPVVPVKP